MILAGNVSIYKIKDLHSAKKTFIKDADLGELKVFGEYALVTDKLRTATMQCSTDVLILKMNKDNYNRILKPLEIEELNQFINDIKQFKGFEQLKRKI